MGKRGCAAVVKANPLAAMLSGDGRWAAGVAEPAGFDEPRQLAQRDDIAI